MSAGLILPEGREPDSVLQTATSLASEEKRKREQKKESPRMIYVLLCRRRNKSSDLAQRGKQAIKHRINSEMFPFFEKPQMSRNLLPCQSQSLCFMSSRPFYDSVPVLKREAWPPVRRWHTRFIRRSELAALGLIIRVSGGERGDSCVGGLL